MSKYTFIDLFSGCGGLTEGFLQSGHFESLAHIEWEKPMVETLRNRLVTNWHFTPEKAKREVVLFDIQDTDELISGDWSPDNKVKYGPYNDEAVINGGLKNLIGDKSVDLIIGGPPCQAYSIHGRATDKNSMKDDYRNYLFESFVKVVDSFRPKMFVFENVPGILSAKPGGINVTNRIYEAFSEIGYQIRNPKDLPSSVFDAVDFQVPQNRKRVIILGIRNDLNFNLDSFYQSIENEKSKLPKRTVRDAIGTLPKIYPLKEPQKVGRVNISHSVADPDLLITQHNPRYNALREINIFQEWILKKMNYASHQEQIEYYYKKTGHKTLYTKYKNLEWDKPSHTVVAHLSKDGMMFIHPDPKQARSITIREAALLMSFPLDYNFIGSNAYCFKMIGNAVPVLFAKGIACGIFKEFKKNNI